MLLRRTVTSTWPSKAPFLFSGLASCASECSLIVNASPSTLPNCLQHCGVGPAPFYLITHWSNHGEQCRIPTMSKIFFARCDIIFPPDCGLVYVIAGQSARVPRALEARKTGMKDDAIPPHATLKACPHPLALPQRSRFLYPLS